MNNEQNLEDILRQTRLENKLFNNKNHPINIYKQIGTNIICPHCKCHFKKPQETTDKKQIYIKKKNQKKLSLDTQLITKIQQKFNHQNTQTCQTHQDQIVEFFNNKFPMTPIEHKKILKDSQSFLQQQRVEKLQTNIHAWNKDPLDIIAVQKNPNQNTHQYTVNETQQAYRSYKQTKKDLINYHLLRKKCQLINNYCISQQKSLQIPAYCKMMLYSDIFD